MKNNETPEEFDARVKAFNEKKESRIDNLHERARRLLSESDHVYKQSSVMASVIPFGQPILVGHHSETRDRNYRRRIGKMMDKSIELNKEANLLIDRAHAAEHNNVISSDDPQAIIKLKEKLERLLASREQNTAINKILRSKKIADKAASLGLLGISETTVQILITPDRFGRTGIPSYVNQNMSGNIKTIRERIEHLEKIATVEDTQKEVKGILIVQDTADNRIRIKFSGKPAQAVIDDLKYNGYRWSPMNKAWQRMISLNGMRRAEELINRHF